MSAHAPKKHGWPVAVAGLRIYPPDNEYAVFVPFTKPETCSRIGVLRAEAVEPVSIPDRRPAASAQ